MALTDDYGMPLPADPTPPTSTPGVSGVMPAAPPPTADMANLNPNIPGGIPTAMPTPPTPPPQQPTNQDIGLPQPFQGEPATRGGPVKNILTRMFYGMGQAGLAHVGLPTDYDIYKTNLTRSIQANDLQLAQRKQQLAEQAQQFQQTQTPYVLPNGNTVLLTPAMAAKVLPADVAGQYKERAAQTTARFRVDPTVGMFDTQPPGGGPPKLVEGSSVAGAILSPEMAADLGVPADSPFIGQHLTLPQLNAIGAAYGRTLPTIRSSTQTINAQGDVTTVGTTRKGGVPSRGAGTVPPLANVPATGVPSPPTRPPGAPTLPTSAPSATPGIGTYIPGVPDEQINQMPVAGRNYLLNSVPQKFRASVYSMIEGKTQLPSASTRSALPTAQRNWAMTADPTLNEERFGLMKKYTERDTGLQAINTALSHAGVLADAVPALNNGNLKILNGIANRLGVETGSTPAAVFQTIVHRLGPELAKAYIANGGSAGERGADEKDFDPSLPPQTLLANLGASIKLLNGALGFRGHEWQQNAAPWMDFNSRFLTPDARKTLNTFGGGAAPQQTKPVSGGIGIDRDANGRITGIR